MTELTGRAITVYRQQEVVKDLIAAQLFAGGQILFGVGDVRLDGLTEDEPAVGSRTTAPYRSCGATSSPAATGSRGVPGGASADGVLSAYERTYPFAWLGILAQAAVDRGADLPLDTRLRAGQHAVADDLAAVPAGRPGRRPRRLVGAGRVWDELHSRLEVIGDWRLTEKPGDRQGHHAITEHGVEPMQVAAAVYLASDAVTSCRPTGAKGMNLALADVRALAALTAWYAEGRTDARESYSRTCLERVWRAQHFS